MSGNRRDTATIRPVGEEPPYLSVGTEVSAKYRGAFCEASIKAVKKIVKCKVNYTKGSGNSTVTDDNIIGPLKVGSDVEVKQPDGQSGVSGTLLKITDSSVYTVVFDDGDERTLKRSSLCIKGEKHFNESETLDHLPLTDPENFGTPVVQQGKKARKGRHQSVSNDGDEAKEDNDVPVRKKLLRDEEITNKVVMVDITEKKKTFSLPALIVSSKSGRKYGNLKSPDNVLVCSFKDGKYLEVHHKDVKQFPKEAANPTFFKGENASMKQALTNAVKFLETKQLPSNWAGGVHLDNSDSSSSSDEELNDDDDQDDNDDDDNDGDHDGDDDGEDDKERSAFMTKLTKFLEENGTPLVRSPVLGHRDLDLYKLYTIVSQMEGMDKIESWHKVYLKMDIPVMTTTASYHIKNAYKRYLFDFERHEREKKLEAKKGGKNEKCTKNSAKQKDCVKSKCDSDKDSKELNLSDITKDEKPLRGARAKKKGDKLRTRSLRSPTSPKLSPRSPCSPKSLSSLSASGSPDCPSPLEVESRELRSKDGAFCDTGKENGCILNEKNILTDVISSDNKEEASEVKNTLSVVTKNQPKIPRNNGRYLKVAVDNLEIRREIKKDNGIKSDCVKKDIKKEDVKKVIKKDEDEKVDVQKNEAEKGDVVENEKVDQDLEGEDAVDVVNSPSGTSNDSVDDEEDHKEKNESNEKIGKEQSDGLKYKLNDRIDVRYGRGRNATVYQAKITSVDPNADEGLYYLVHYAGWNARHDEWIGHERIIGKGQKQPRTRTSSKPPSKFAPKPCSKPVAKKTGKNGSAEKPLATKPAVSGRGRKRTPSPIPANKNGRNSKVKGERFPIDALDLSDIKPYPRVTRQNSASTPVRNPAMLFVEAKSEPVTAEKTPTNKAEDEKKSFVPSPQQANPTVTQSSPRSDVESLSPGKKEENTSVDESLLPKENNEEEISVNKPLESNGKIERNCEELVLKVQLSPPLKRSRNSDSDEPPPAKKTHEDDVIFDVVFEEEKPPDLAPMETKEAASPEPEAAIDDENAPDLTCSEQMSTNCVSPDPYTNEFPEHDGYFGNGIGAEGNGSKEKESSSSFDEAKLAKSNNNRQTKSRRKTRAPSSQSSFEGGDCPNGSSDGTSIPVSPSWTPKYNFTEGLEELLKKEESSERIRLLQEKIKDIRKVYGELKSEVANIDRKRKRRQKRKREEELSAEEGSTRSPSRSSPLSTTNASTVGSSTTLATVECR